MLLHLGKVTRHSRGIQAELQTFLTTAMSGDEWSVSCSSHFTARTESPLPTEQEAG